MSTGLKLVNFVCRSKDSSEVPWHSIIEFDWPCVSLVWGAIFVICHTQNVSDRDRVSRQLSFWSVLGNSSNCANFVGQICPWLAAANKNNQLLCETWPVSLHFGKITGTHEFNLWVSIPIDLAYTRWLCLSWPLQLIWPWVKDWEAGELWFCHFW